ncbi:MAG: IS630 family transposase [Candidatus Sericytochromatia bacterium]|nr:IS630 family transposase [Candidatus Tanganyikabacteria bacterium]
MLRDEFAAWVEGADPDKLVFLDEAGSNISMTRDYARSESGERAHDKVPRNRGTVTSMLGALSLQGLTAMMTVAGGTSAEVFQVFAEQVLIPALPPGAIVVMDNAGAHKAAPVLDTFAAANVEVRFLPPYSPDLNPIELAWAKLKRLLKEAKARTRDALDAAIGVILDAITPFDAGGWFRHCGYRS